MPESNSTDSESYLDFAYLEPFMVIEEEVKPRFNLDDNLQLEVESILSQVLQEYQEKTTGYVLMVKALLLKLLILTGRAFSKEIKGTAAEAVLNKYKGIVYNAINFMKENYYENLTIKSISASMNYSSSHFSFLFKAITGKTFVEYLNEIRINKSIELLKNTDISIIDIAYKVGFNTLSNFNKAFKGVTGLAPSNYRKTMSQALSEEALY